ncbi:nuclear transport factor 2 family protein [Chitinophaga sp. YIM B06452]|uniref:nuclear transport factor 2 family protein n=1 Tax=Chitinophaga sp. YIM B06452 TaxID=3082158 RepID=UPI0031FE6048
METNTINTLLEIEAIKKLKAQYARAVDTKQWEALDRLFAPSPQLVFISSKGEVEMTFHESASFVEVVKPIQLAKTAHHVHNPEIEILSDTTAQGIWALEDQIRFPQGVEGPFKTFHGYGHYHETYEKVNGEWKIKTLRLERTYLTIDGIES